MLCMRSFPCRPNGGMRGTDSFESLPANCPLGVQQRELEGKSCFPWNCLASGAPHSVIQVMCLHSREPPFKRTSYTRLTEINIIFNEMFGSHSHSGEFWHPWCTLLLWCWSHISISSIMLISIKGIAEVAHRISQLDDDQSYLMTQISKTENMCWIKWRIGLGTVI